jgi:hypothetical protein
MRAQDICERPRRGINSSAIVFGPICALVAVSAFGIWSYHRNQITQGGTQLLDVPAAALDFGEEWSRSDFSWAIPLKNVTRFPVIMERLDTSCDCTHAAQMPISFAPGETKCVLLTVDLTRKLTALCGNRTRFSVSLTPVLRDHQSQIGWVLRGTVRSAVSLSAASVAFGEVLVRAEVAPARLTVRCADEIGGLMARSDFDVAETTVRKLNAGPNEYHLLISPKPAARIGRIRSHVQLFAIDLYGQAVGPFPIPISLVAVSPIKALPNCLHLGRASAGIAVQRSIRLTSRTGVPFAVSGISSAGSENCTTALAGDVNGTTFAESINCRIEITPLKPCDTHTEVSIATIDAAGHSEVVELPVTFTILSEPIQEDGGDDS